MVNSCSPVSGSLAMLKTMALFGVPMISMWAKDDAKAVANPTISGEVPERVAIGTVMGPTAATVAPSLIKLVSIPVIKLVEMQSPVPLFKKSGSTDTKAVGQPQGRPGGCQTITHGAGGRVQGHHIPVNAVDVLPAQHAQDI